MPCHGLASRRLLCLSLLDSFQARGESAVQAQALADEGAARGCSQLSWSYVGALDAP